MREFKQVRAVAAVAVIVFLISNCALLPGDPVEEPGFYRVDSEGFPVYCKSANYCFSAPAEFKKKVIDGLVVKHS